MTEILKYLAAEKCPSSCMPTITPNKRTKEEIMIIRSRIDSIYKVLIDCKAHSLANLSVSYTS